MLVDRRTDLGPRGASYRDVLPGELMARGALLLLSHVNALGPPFFAWNVCARRMWYFFERP